MSTTKLTTLADLKRAMTAGTVVTVTNHKFPNLSGARKVLIAQTNSWCMTFPAGHERHNPDEPIGSREGSWLDIPKAKDVTFDGNSAHITRPNWNDGGPFVTITLDQQN